MLIEPSVGRSDTEDVTQLSVFRYHFPLRYSAIKNDFIPIPIGLYSKLVEELSVDPEVAGADRF